MAVRFSEGFYQQDILYAMYDVWRDGETDPKVVAKKGCDQFFYGMFGEGFNYSRYLLREGLDWRQLFFWADVIIRHRWYIETGYQKIPHAIRKCFPEWPFAGGEYLTRRRSFFGPY